MLRQFRLFLGPQRFNALLGLLVSTGLGSFALVLVDAPWSVAAQTVLALAFIIGAVVLIGGRMSPAARGLWTAILVPAFGLVLLGALFLPHLMPFLMGAAAGWVIIGMMIFGRSRGPMQYRAAVKHMRKGEFSEAVDEISDLIKSEPEDVQHYAFRARLLRMWNKPARARRDYETMLRLSDEAGFQVVAYNGLAELELQTGRYEAALDAAEKAVELAPDDPVAFYNLGMIQDRLGQSEAVIESLQMSLDKKMRDPRHQVLIHLYLLRAYMRLGDRDRAEAELTTLKKLRAGLQEWHVIMEKGDIKVLKDVLGDDIRQAQALVDDEMTPDDVLAGVPA